MEIKVLLTPKHPTATLPGRLQRAVGIVVHFRFQLRQVLGLGVAASARRGAHEVLEHR